MWWAQLMLANIYNVYMSIMWGCQGYIGCYGNIVYL